MKRAFFRAALLAIGLCVGATTAMAQDDADPRSLDLSVPQERIHFASTHPGANYRNDPPGTFYGDRSGRAAPEDAIATAPDGDWQVHGAVEAGIGWSERTGNSNWQAANINLDKTYTHDDGDASHVNIDISVGRGSGALFAPGYFAPDYYGPAGFAPGPRMRGASPLVR